jgi:hypothetical protein
LHSKRALFLGGGFGVFIQDFCALYFFFLFTGGAVNCFVFAPLSLFSTLASVFCFWVVVLEFFCSRFFAPFIFLPFHERSRELFCFCAPFVFFTLAQQA